MARPKGSKRERSRNSGEAPVDSSGPLLAQLSAARPADFVAERARVAAALKAAGHTSEAARVRALRRPASSVWAVNHLARTQPAAVAALLTLGARVRAHESALLAGGDGRDFLQEARELRQQAAHLSRRAEALAKAASVVVNAAAVRRIAQTLMVAAAGDDELRRALASGTIAEDLSAATGFGGPSGDLSSALAASVGHAATQSAPTTKRADPPSAPVARVKAEAKAAPDTAAKKRAAAAVRAEARAKRQAEAAARRAHATAQRRAQTQARQLAKRRAAAEHNIALCRAEVERARAAFDGAQKRLRTAEDALAKAELARAALEAK